MTASCSNLRNEFKKLINTYNGIDSCFTSLDLDKDGLVEVSTLQSALSPDRIYHDMLIFIIGQLVNFSGKYRKQIKRTN